MNVIDVAGSNNLRILRLLVAVPGSVSQDDLDLALVVCVKQGHVEGAGVLLQVGASPDASDKSSNFALKIAAEKGYCDMMSLLAEHGASLNQGNHQRGTALHHAASSNSAASVATLIHLGANINSRDSSDCTPLIICAQTKHFSPMNELIQAKCGLDLVDDKGRTALHYACHKAMGVDTLLKAGANPNVKDNDDNYPIHMAATEGFDNVIIKLLDHGCDPDVQNCFQKTALHYLAMKNHCKAVEAIAEIHGDLSVFDAEGKSPLYYAVLRNRPEAVKALLRHNCPLVFTHNDCKADPLAHALKKELFGIAKLLVLAGAPLGPVYEWTSHVETEREEREEERRQRNRIFSESEDEGEDDESDNEDDVDGAFEWFEDWLHRPHTLQQLCRLAIRHYVGPGMMAKQDNLPVPAAIRDYITLREVEDHHVQGFLM